MADHPRGVENPRKDSDGQHGGNRGGQHRPRPDPGGPGNDRQAQGKDPHRGEPSGPSSR